MADIIELILDDHRRIARLAASLHEATRCCGAEPSRVLLCIWDRLAGLIEAHTAAEEELCWLAMAGTGPSALTQLGDLTADGRDIREALAEARLQSPGSVAWWLAVNDAVRRCAERSALEESSILPGFAGHASQQLRTRLGRHWLALAAAHRHGEEREKDEEAATQDVAAQRATAYR